MSEKIDVEALRAKLNAALALMDKTTGEIARPLEGLPANAWSDAVFAILDAAPALLAAYKAHDAAVREREAFKAKYGCPIGAENGSITCSAGSCPECLSACVATLTAERDALKAERDALAKLFGFSAALDICNEGLRRWREKPHNAKWWRRIDGTPIPNDLMVNIADAMRDTADETKPD